MRLPFKNHTVFAGYVGNDVELRRLDSGDVSVSLRIVAKQSYKVGAEWKTVEEWATAIFYRKLAEDLAASGVAKGSFVHVEGRRHTRTWTDAQKRTKSTPEIIVAEWHEVVLPAADRAKAPTDKPAAPAARPKRADAPPASTSRAERDGPGVGIESLA